MTLIHQFHPFSIPHEHLRSFLLSPYAGFVAGKQTGHPLQQTTRAVRTNRSSDEGPPLSQESTDGSFYGLILIPDTPPSFLDLGRLTTTTSPSKKSGSSMRSSTASCAKSGLMTLSSRPGPIGVP